MASAQRLGRRREWTARFWLIAGVLSGGATFCPAAENGNVLPVPTPVEQAKPQKVIRELFANDFAKRTPIAEVQLAKRLLEEAAKSEQDAIARYVLLMDARDLAAAGGETNLTLDAIDRISSRYETRRDELIAGSLDELAKAPMSSQSAASAEEAAAELADRQCEADDYAAAEHTALKAELFASRTRDAKLQASARSLKALVKTRQRDAEHFKAALEKLKQTPDDPDANLTAGTFLCFTRGDWAHGLSYLSKGSDKELKDAAVAEMSAKSDDAVKVGDRWWNAAEAKDGVLRQRMRRRAAEWYARAMPNLTGLVAELTRKRIAQAEQDGGAGINLIAMVDPARDAISGSWSINDGQLKEQGGDSIVRLQIPYRPTDEYDLTVVYKYLTGSEGMMLILPTSRGQVMLVNNSTSSYCEVDQGAFDKRDHALLKPGETCTVVARVRRDRVTITANGLLLADFGTNERPMKVRWHLRDENAIGLGNWNTTIIFSKITLNELHGTGSPLR